MRARQPDAPPGGEHPGFTALPAVVPRQALGAARPVVEGLARLTDEAAMSRLAARGGSRQEQQGSVHAREGSGDAAASPCSYRGSLTGAYSRIRPRSRKPTAA